MHKHICGYEYLNLFEYNNTHSQTHIYIYLYKCFVPLHSSTRRSTCISLPPRDTLGNTRLRKCFQNNKNYHHLEENMIYLNMEFGFHTFLGCNNSHCFLS